MTLQHGTPRRDRAVPVAPQLRQDPTTLDQLAHERGQFGEIAEHISEFPSPLLRRRGIDRWYRAARRDTISESRMCARRSVACVANRQRSSPITFRSRWFVSPVDGWCWSEVGRLPSLALGFSGLPVMPTFAGDVVVGPVLGSWWWLWVGGIAAESPYRFTRRIRFRQRRGRCAQRREQPYAALPGDIHPRSSSREITAALALENQTGGGSIRSIVLMRSMDRSKEATLLIPVLSAHATRYASAKSIRSVS